MRDRNKIKKAINILVLFFIALSSSAINNNFKYEKMAHGIQLDKKSFITKVTVVTDEIIHVEKYLDGQQRNKIPDLVGELKPQNINWTVYQSDDLLTLETDKIKVTIDKKGLINYFSKNGSVYLKENNYRTYVHPDTLSTYQVSQAFDAGDEGLYGLGQFQNGIMNWKNVPIRLKQFNQEIANPVLLSTKKYGIFWNNYSVTDFNFPDNKIIFDRVVDKKLNIKATTFIPKETGIYSFIVVSETPSQKNRRLGKILVTCNADTVIHYDVIWKPDSFAGKIRLEAGKHYEITFEDSQAQVEGRLYYNKPSFNKTIFSSIRGGSIDYYFIAGKNPQEVLSSYTSLTGRAPLFAKSSYGFWQCREAYHTQDEVLESARGYRKRQIPVDNIVQDWNYWLSKGPEWDRSRYPNPKSMIDTLNEMHFNLMVSVWPAVQNKTLLEKYNLEQLKGCPFVDFYNPEMTSHYYKMLSDSMFNIGVKSIWLDGSEPSYQPDADCNTLYGDFKNVANIYSLLVTKAVYEGHKAEFPNQRIFNLTRSAFAGQQKYGNAVWSGDIAGTWEQFREQIPAGLNLVMTGIPYWTTDIGGFFRDSKSGNPFYDDEYTNPEYRELLTRWFEYGTFCPIFRIHGYRTHTEIWNFGPEFEKIARKYINLRYQLMPYIYSEAWEVTKYGQLMMSPLTYMYPEDKNVWNIKDQFFFGESMMICPVVNYKARSRKVYLPKGEWYDFWTNEKLKGGRYVTAKASLEQIPIYIKAGTILPMGPKVQYAMQKTDKPLILRVYPGKDTQYTLYQDDGLTNKYEKGNYKEIKIIYTDKNQNLYIPEGLKNYKVEIKK